MKLETKALSTGESVWVTYSWDDERRTRFVHWQFSHMVGIGIGIGVAIAIGIFEAKTDSDSDIRRWRQNLDSIVFP